MADDHHATPSRTDYTVHKGEVSLAVYRKHVGPAPGQPPCPVLFLVHGSSNSALSSFDLTVPGAGEYSTMNSSPGSASTCGRWITRITGVRREPRAIRTSP